MSDMYWMVPCGIAIYLAIGAAAGGYVRAKDDEMTDWLILGPLLLAVALTAVPFVACYRLGKWVGERFS